MEQKKDDAHRVWPEIEAPVKPAKGQSGPRDPKTGKSNKDNGKSAMSGGEIKPAPGDKPAPQ